jgi:hypothetical protein
MVRFCDRRSSIQSMGFGRGKRTGLLASDSGGGFALETQRKGFVRTSWVAESGRMGLVLSCCLL